MKKAIMYIVIGLVVYFLLWKFVIKTSKKTLADGSMIYKKGGNFYVSKDGNEVKIDQVAYNRLNVYKAGDCTNPNVPQIQSAATCEYFGYKGIINECGDCTLATPITRACPPTKGNCGNGGTLYLQSADAKNCNYACYE